MVTDLGKTPEPGQPPNQPLPASVSMEVFLQYLGDEIEHLKAEQERPGWTPWALAGALAAVVWLMLATLQDYLLMAGGVFLAYISVSLLVGAGIVLRFAASPSQNTGKSEQGRFFILSEKHGNLRVTSLLAALKSALLVVLPWGIPGVLLPLYSKIAITVLYAMVCALALVCLFISISRIPSSGATTASGRKGKLIVFFIKTLIYAAFLLTPIAVIAGMAALGSWPTFPEIRFGCLLLAAAFIIGQLCWVPEDRSTLLVLRDIRRSLVVGRIGLNSAVRQVDMALFGLSLDQVVRDQLAKVMQRFAQADSEATKAQTYATAAEALADKGETNRKDVLTLLASAKKSLEAAKSLFDHNEDVRDLGKRIGLALGPKKSDDQQEKEILDRIGAVIEDATRRYNAAAGKHNAVAARLRTG